MGRLWGAFIREQVGCEAKRISTQCKMFRQLSLLFTVALGAVYLTTICAEGSSESCPSHLRAWCFNFTKTELDRYVARPDPHYHYDVISHEKGLSHTVYVLNMTSQKWLNESVVSRSLWWHTVTVVVPHILTHKAQAFLWIGSGSNPGRNSHHHDKLSFFPDLVTIALTTQAVVAQIQQVPNQPIVFESDPSHAERKEEAITAWGWKEFIERGAGVEYLIRLPMTKAAVRAMDTVTDFVQGLTGNEINQYMVAGASKRGWTTWTTAAVDSRVVAMAPVVMDLLNFQKSLHHHFRSLGGWTLAFQDFYNVSFTADIDNPRIQDLMASVDPLVYRARYNLHKVIISATGDEFFLPDNSYYYFNQLPEPTYLRMVANAEHTMFGHRTGVVDSLASFWLTVLTNTPLPKVNWQRIQTPTSGKLSVELSQKPLEVKLYHARTLDDGRRDFRLLQMGPNHKPLIHKIMWFWTKPKLSDPLHFDVEMKTPDSGYLGFLIEMTFQGAKNSTLTFTTEVNIIPNTFPFPDCHGQSCKGSLV